MMCQKCWEDAYTRSFLTGKTQGEAYFELLKERKDHPCSDLQQEYGNDVPEELLAQKEIMKEINSTRNRS